MIRFTDIYVGTVARGLCEPNEHFICAGAGVSRPLWSLGLPWFRRAYLLVATTTRLVVVEHRSGFLAERMERVSSIPWNEVSAIALTGSFRRRLVVRGASELVLLDVTIPRGLASPLGKNMSGLRLIVQAWEQRRSVMALAAAAKTLPPSPPGYPPLPPLPRLDSRASQSDGAISGFVTR